MTGNRRLGFGRRRYSRLFLAIAELLVIIVSFVLGLTLSTSFSLLFWPYFGLINIAACCAANVGYKKWKQTEHWLRSVTCAEARARQKATMTADILAATVTVQYRSLRNGWQIAMYRSTVKPSTSVGEVYWPAM